jgi:hypothetical protein
MCDKMKMIHPQEWESWWSPSLSELPYQSMDFLDNSNFKAKVTFSGPDGVYEEAPHKQQYEMTYWAIYTGWKCIHCVKVETLFMPHGLATLFGPVS